MAGCIQCLPVLACVQALSRWGFGGAHPQGAPEPRERACKQANRCQNYFNRNMWRPASLPPSSDRKHEKIAVGAHVLVNIQNVVILRCCFAEDG